MKGEDNANGGHCLVNWPTVTKPKDLGGVGMPDLDRFGRALSITMALASMGGRFQAMDRLGAPLQ